MALIRISVPERNHNRAGPETSRKIAYGERSIGAKCDARGMLLVPALARDETLQFGTKSGGASGMAMADCYQNSERFGYACEW